MASPKLLPLETGVKPRRKHSSAANSYHHGDLRNALISEGRRLLEEVGLRDMSLREVARRLGVSEAAPSRHFDGKVALLAAIAQSGYDELAHERQKVLADARPPLEAMRQMMTVYIEFAQNHAGIFYLMAGPKIIDRNIYPDLLQSSNVSFTLFADAVCAFAKIHGWPKSQHGAVVIAAWATEHGLANLILSNRLPRADYPVPIAEMIDSSLAMLSAGIAAGPRRVNEMRGSKPRKPL
ncbi:TetR/AcrR family transcriptional regulator [Variovorax sp. J22G40]|nr:MULTISPECIES: TetR/AcrR family transcriptional regulator [unclassified Variovorax]MDM0087971.1 TetR/AcrR family transcriptional regulator [Variovorax sp. J22G40]MDM0146044.1 TetR/AcrR family transcriptional regulator [Variovorax sp. J2P1-31]